MPKRNSGTVAGLVMIVLGLEKDLKPSKPIHPKPLAPMPPKPGYLEMACSIISFAQTLPLEVLKIDLLRF